MSNIPLVRKPTPYQVKTLSSNVSANGTVSDLGFNNLEVGKTYRLSGKIHTYSNDIGGPRLTFANGSNTLTEVHRDNSAASDASTSKGIGGIIFVATATTIVATATSTATGSLGVIQLIEDVDLVKNREMTFSAWVKSNTANSRLGILDGSSWIGFSDPHTGGGDWELLTVTVTVTTGSEFRCYIRMMTDVGATTSITSGDYIEFTGASLVIGDRSAGFQPRSEAVEIELCQRYYEKSYNLNTAPLTPTKLGAIVIPASSVLNTLEYGTVVWKTTKRATPTVTFYPTQGSIVAHVANDNQTGSNFLANSAANANSSEYGVHIKNNQGSTINTTFGHVSVQYVADAEL